MTNATLTSDNARQEISELTVALGHKAKKKGAVRATVRGPHFSLEVVFAEAIGLQLVFDPVTGVTVPMAILRSIKGCRVRAHTADQEETSEITWVSGMGPSVTFSKFTADDLETLRLEFLPPAES